MKKVNRLHLATQTAIRKRTKKPNITSPSANEKTNTIFFSQENFETASSSRRSRNKFTLSTDFDSKTITKPNTEFPKVLSPSKSTFKKIVGLTVSIEKKFNQNKKGLLLTSPELNGVNFDERANTHITKSIKSFNKQLIRTHIFKGHNDVLYSKKNLDLLDEYIDNQEFERNKKAAQQNNQPSPGEPKGLKKIRYGITQEEFSLFQMRKEKDEVEKVMKKSEKFAEKVIDAIRTTKKSDRKHKEYGNKYIDYDVLDKKIQIYNLLQNAHGNGLDPDLREIQDQDNFLEQYLHKQDNHDFSSPGFLKRKFNKVTVRKYKGSDGQFFGSPV